MKGPPFKAKQVELYRRFLQSANFSSWYHEYQTEAMFQLRQSHQSSIIKLFNSDNNNETIDLLDENQLTSLLIHLSSHIVLLPLFKFFILIDYFIFLQLFICMEK